jgi:hypothetical protein
MNAPPPAGVSRPEEKQTSLYRHFAADGSLLYVGISLSWPARTRSHSHSSTWFEQVVRVEIEQFLSREAALEAERSAIKSERPKFNVIHNRPEKPARPRPPQSDLGIVSEGSLSLLSSKERRRYRQQLMERNPLLQKVRGPHAIVGPALIYRDNLISVMVAHGQFGTEGELTELVLGQYIPDLPEWTDNFASVLVLRGMGELTLDEARSQRRTIVETLRAHLEIVQAFDTDIALATAYATQFPSDQSRRLLDHVASEQRR